MITVARTPRSHADDPTRPPPPPPPTTNPPLQYPHTLRYIWFEAAHPAVNRTWLAPTLTVLAAAISYLHVMEGFVLVFQVTFGLMVLVGFYNVVLFGRSPDCDDEGRRLGKLYIGSTTVAAAFWIMDLHLCVWTQPFQFHAWWHVFTGYSTWVCIQLGIYARARCEHVPTRPPTYPPTHLPTYPPTRSLVSF